MIFQITLKIEDMRCGMCEAHICDVIRKTIPDATKVTASRNGKEATFLTKEKIDRELLQSAIDATGYTCSGIVSDIYEKKGWLGWK